MTRQTLLGFSAIVDGVAAHARDPSAPALAAVRRTLERWGRSADALDAMVINAAPAGCAALPARPLVNALMLELDRSDVPVITLSMPGCVHAMRVAANLVLAEALRNVLVVDLASSTVEEGTAASAFIVTSVHAEFDVLSMAHTSLPSERADSSVDAQTDLTGCREVVERALTHAGVRLSDLAAAFCSDPPQRAQALAKTMKLPLAGPSFDGRQPTGRSVDPLAGLRWHSDGGMCPAGSTFLLVHSAQPHYTAVVCRRR